MKNRDISPEDNQDLDQERIVQTNSNLTLMDRRPGESAFPTGTKNHSTKYDHANSDVPLELINDVSLEDNLTTVDSLYEAEHRALHEDGLDNNNLNDDDLDALDMDDLDDEQEGKSR